MEKNMLSKDKALQLGNATTEQLGSLCQQASDLRDRHWEKGVLLT